MAEEQKPVEVKETTPATTTEAPAAETKPAETTEAPAAAAPATTEETPATTTETTADATATEGAAAPAEEAKKEVTPVEEGTLEHKGLNFPKNFIYSKEFFWFGSDAVESKNLSSYLKTEKSAETAHHNAAWAAHTGKGLFFFGDKTAPQGVINLADASEPAADGANKFHFTAKGHKHTFKAANAEERDNWIAQLKLKITEAKEIGSTVTETEAYKTALESFKPAKKEEKKEEKAAETPAAEPAAAAAATETPATEAAAPVTEEAPKETPAVEEPKKEEPKRRSASRKRASIFGNLLGKKEESKKEEKKEEAATTEETPAIPAIEPVAAAEAPATETAAPAVETPATTEPATEAAAAAPATEEAAKEEKKPAPPTKRNSIFGVFGKKEKKAQAAAEAEAPATPAKEEVTPAAETAPVIPPVEATTPLAVDVANPSTVPVEIKETAPATNGEPRPDLKEKRKSSLPFGFGKRDKSPAAKSPAHSDNEEGEKQEKTSAFSKLRATIKGRGKAAADKPADKLEKTEEKPEEPAAEAAKPAEETPAETSKATEEPENKPENVASSTPAPVTAAA